MTGRVTMIMQRLDPAAGLERSCVGVAELLSRHGFGVRILSLRAGVAAPLRSRLARTEIELVEGRRALITSHKALRRQDGPVIVAGLWAAAMLTPTVIRNERLLYWEHSLSGDRLAAEAKTRAVARLAKHLITRATTCVAVSDAAAEALGAFVRPTNLVVIPNPVDLNEVPRSKWPSGGRLVAVGSLNRTKNYELALRCMSILPEDHTLEICGDGPLRPQLEAMVRELGLEGRVTFLGHRDDVGEALGRAAVMIHSSSAETFGLSVLEAGARDVAVASLDLPVFEQLIPDLVMGVRAVSADPESLAAAVSAAGELHNHDPAGFGRARLRRSAAFEPESIVKTWASALRGES